MTRTLWAIALSGPGIENDNSCEMNSAEPVPFVIRRQGTVPEPPCSRRELGATLWREILSDRRLTSRPELTILEHARQALDRAKSPAAADL